VCRRVSAPCGCCYFHLPWWGSHHDNSRESGNPENAPKAHHSRGSWNPENAPKAHHFRESGNPENAPKSHHSSGSWNPE